MGLSWPEGEVGEALTEALNQPSSGVVQAYSALSAPGGSNMTPDMRTRLFIMLSYSLDFADPDTRQAIEPLCSSFFKDTDPGGAFFMMYCVDKRSLIALKQAIEATSDEDKRQELTKLLTAVYAIAPWIVAVVMFCKIDEATTELPYIECALIRSCNAVLGRPDANFYELDMSVRGVMLCATGQRKMDDVKKFALDSRHALLRNAIEEIVLDREASKKRDCNLFRSIIRLAAEIQCEGSASAEKIGSDNLERVAHEAECALASRFRDAHRSIVEEYVKQHPAAAGEEHKSVPEMFAQTIIVAETHKLGTMKLAQALYKIDFASALAFVFCLFAGVHYAEDWWSCTNGVRICIGVISRFKQRMIAERGEPGSKKAKT